MTTPPRFPIAEPGTPSSRPPENCVPIAHRPLSSMEQMQIGIVVDVRADEVDSARLKALGICQGRRIQLVKAGDPLILRVLGTRVGLSARLADGITVEPCGSC